LSASHAAEREYDAGGENLINQALRAYIERSQEPLEAILRRVVTGRTAASKLRVCQPAGLFLRIYIRLVKNTAQCANQAFASQLGADHERKRDSLGAVEQKAAGPRKTGVALRYISRTYGMGSTGAWGN
jgi:hypothetical protein